MPTSSHSRSSSAQLSTKVPKRRYTKQELLKHLEILGPITNPLPATLPPSPPASRSASPAPELTQSSKRKRNDSDSGTDVHSTSSYKRSRCSHDDGHTGKAPLTPPGDDAEELNSTTSPPFPVKRPRRGRRPDAGGYGAVHQKYMDQGKLFKRSCDARINVYQRLDSSAYVQLLNRPPHGSPYQKHDRIMAKFEALDSVLCFAYAQWYHEMWSNRHDLLWWQNSAAFFEVCKAKHLEAFPQAGPREEALLGIHFMVDAYWKARHAWHMLRYNVENKVSSLLVEHKQSQSSPAATKSPPASDSGARSSSVHQHAGTMLQPTPPSTGHSPATNQGTSTDGSSARSPNIPPGHLSVPFSEDLARHIQTGTKLHIQSGDAFLHASQRLSLSVLENHFPRTFARVSKSTLRYNEEWEIDFEDEESELFWPMGPTRGEGLGWVLALGRSMLREYAKDYGYKGIGGVLKPEDIVYPNRK